MKATIVVACILLLQMAQQGHCGDDESYDDAVDLSERQYDCQYMWMMMNNGSCQAGLSSCLLLILAIGASLFSTDIQGSIRS